jgi:hypothetical protein
MVKKIFLTAGLPFIKYGINVKSIVLQSKFLRMKKFLMVLTVAGFVACNNSSDSSATSADSTVKAVDSTASAAKDTVAKVADSAAKKIDSTAKAVKDSVKK